MPARTAWPIGEARVEFARAVLRKHAAFMCGLADARKELGVDAPAVIKK